ncbi:uncharacterized protein LOC107273227 isoform X3 [Cephus cinctus]|uniref:Uncharacterized protein LOC107273227 isoform X3 n=1 Tax=Cephus cinctus TaxID=211228 RepID=A0AAJ7RSH0_CEPCN|nr:uncharacterized protein LOC107273227 isoform X3 [Cephus cinctus]
MSSYKSYVPWSKRERENSYSSTKSDSSTQNDTSYRPRTVVGVSTSNFSRNTGSGSGVPSYRSYSSVGSSANRVAAKDRNVATYGSAYNKGDRSKLDEKSSTTYKYSSAKEPEKSRLHTGRTSSEDLRSKSPLSGCRSSLLEKYSYRDTGKSNERSSSLLDKYSRDSSREKSREPEVISRYGSSTYPGSGLSRSYGSDVRNEKKERSEHPPVSYRGLRPTSGRSSREPSPEVSSGKTGSSRMYSRTPSYSRAGTSAPETISTPVSSRYGSAASRYSTVSARSSTDRTPTAISYSGSDRFRSSTNKPVIITSCADEDARSSTKSEKDTRNESMRKSEEAESKVETISDNEDEDYEEVDDKVEELVTVTVVTRGTSPTPPASSTYVRTRRADSARVLQKEVTRSRNKPETKDEEIQSDRMDDTARYSRYGSGARVAASPWTSYLDKYTPGGAAYCSRTYNSSNNTSSTSSRVGFGYSRSNESPTLSRVESTSKMSPGSSQEVVATSKIQNDQSGKVQSNDQYPCSVTKTDVTTELNSSPNCDSREVSPGAQQNFMPKTNGKSHLPGRHEADDNSQRRGSIPRLGRASPKSEVKLSRSSSKGEFSGRLPETCQRRGSTPKSDSSSSTRVDEVPEVCQRRDASQKRESSIPRKDSLQRSDSNSSQGAKSISRNNSGKNITRQISRTDSSDGSVAVPSNRSKSSSASSMTNPSTKIKSAPTPTSPGKCCATSGTSVNMRQGTSPDGGARGKPPVPKSDSGAMLKSGNMGKYVNKDFRKSALNMDNGDGTRTKLDRKHGKSQRSVSVSSQDSQSEANSEPLMQVASSGSSGSIKSNHSISKLKVPSGISKTLSNKMDSPPRRKSPSVLRLDPKKSRSVSGSPSRKKKLSRTPSSSSDSSESSSSSSTSSDDDEEPQRPGSRRHRRHTSNSPLQDKRGKSSAGSSRTSVLASSTDELSLNIDKPPRPPSSPRSRSDRSGKTEEAKSFLMRALAPVTNLFKTKQQESTESRSGWPESTDETSEPPKKSGQSLSKSITQSLSKSLSFTNSDKSEKRKSNKIKHQSSGEKAWWMDSNPENVPEGIIKGSISNDDITQDTTISTVLPDDGKFKFKVWRQESGERAWWLDANENIPEEPRKESNSSSSSSKKNSNRSSTKSEKKNRLKHQQSGERAWWMSDDPESVPEGVEVLSPPATAITTAIPTENNEPVKFDEVETEYSRATLHKIRHIDSGEKPWWMDSSSNVPEGVEKISTELSKSNSDSSESLERLEIGSPVLQSGEFRMKRSLSRFPIEFPPPPPPEEPLGDRASPEGVENPPDPPDNYGRDSPYDNIQPNQTIRRSPPRRRPSTLPLFIGNHTNIDDLLGDSLGPAHSPVKSLVRKQEILEESSSDESSECEEIDATQVIIHDSTPKTPIIQRRNRNHERSQPDGYIPRFSNGPNMSLTCRVQYLNDVDPFAYASSYPEPPRPPVHTFSATLPLINQLAAVHRLLRAPHRLDDTALQLYKDGDYGAYLDLEASISEQQEEFEGFQTNRKNSIVLRTQLSVRVHTIIEKLLNSEGRELRRALFSLKQIFQEDKDLVHEFVQNDGLACLIKVGSEADQNYQNYILRALGQVMLYVDGMNGVMEHGQTVQWLYTLIASRFRLVVKTALKLLLVFVEYIETNSLLLVRAVRSVDTSRGMIPWTNVMKLLKDYDAADTELLIYATTLVNKCLNGIPDQDTYYDQVDCLEEQGIEGIIQRYMSKQGTDLDLLRQFQIYEAVLHHEDGNDRGSPIRQLDDNIRKTLRNRKSLVDSHERRKSRRHSTGTSPLSMSLNARLSPRLNHSLGLNSLNSTLNNTLNNALPDDDDESSSSQSSQGLGDVQINGSYKENKVDVGVTPALRRRRERAERQRSFIREQQEATANMRASIGHSDDQESPFAANGLSYANGSPYERNADSPSNKLSRGNSRKDLTPLMNVANKLDSEEKKPWYGKSPDEGVECDEGNHTDEDEDRRVVLQLKREGTVKDLTQKLAAQNLIPSSPVEEKVSRIGDMSGLISKAKEGLAKSKSKADVLKSPTGDNLPKLAEVKKSENELHWEELVKKLDRPLALCDLDFTDLNSEDEIDVLSPVNVANGVPPPPPPMVPPGMGARAPPPPPPGGRLPPPLLFGVNLKSTKSPTNSESTSSSKPSSQTAKKSKKTVKLFWKEVRDDPIILSRLEKNKMIWDELSPVPVDTQKLEHLFESRAKDLITKEKQQEMNKNKEVIVLDHKRSNAINIGMTKLPPPRSIKTAILKMDATIMNREGIEKLLTMLPTEEERSRIQEAQAANPDLPLGSAEQFLLTLASISELPARLKLWAFKLDFENSEKEIADPLMDLKQGMETLKVNKTFRGILSTLLSIGIFLNGNEVKGFQLEYLAKVPEVKDTVHKHSLLHHLCHMVMEKFPESTDLYSEIGSVTRASKIDFDELASNIGKLESECKASWDHLKLIAKHDGSTMMKVKMSDFLSDCAERIIVLGIVHRRIINRFHKFILWLGIPLHRLQDTKPNEFCRIVSEFALEYRTTRERVLQQLEKKANHRERNKTRGKMITETAPFLLKVGKFRTKEDRADAELRQLLGSEMSDVESIHGTLSWRRQRKEGRTALGPLLRDESTNGNLTDGDDELLESLVKTATKTPATRTTPRERKRTRHADRKSLKRSRTRENNTTPEGYLP